MMYWKVLIVVALISSSALADSGLCRYDEDKCSCKMGEANQGICWDKETGNPGYCKRRFCRKGWTCSCGGRTHVCTRKNKQVNAPVNPNDASKETAECEQKTRPLVSSRVLLLGTAKIHISSRGIEYDSCNQIAWWHNGVLLGNHGNSSKHLTGGELGDAINQRENHDKLELVPGDIIAFRFKAGSYYCYKHFTEFEVNGTVVNSAMPGFTTHYARKHTKDWYMPSYILDNSNIAADESELDTTKFLPLRRKKLDGSTTIEPKVDYWEPIDMNVDDNKRSNWYYRIKIPKVLPGNSVSLR